MRSLSELRERVKGSTIEILAAVKKRMELIEEIGRSKEELGLPVENLQVERELRTLVTNESRRLGLNEDFTHRLLSILLSESVRAQRMTVDQRPSSTARIYSIARERERSGKKVIHLEIGEPDFDPPLNVVEELARAAKEGRTRYTDPRGIPELRRAIAESLNVEYNKNLEVREDNVLVTPGGRFGIYLAIEGFVRAGGEVIGLEPLWSDYRQCVEHANGRYVTLKTSLEENWTPKVDTILEKSSHSTSILVLNYPNNPTGKILDRKIITEIVEICKDKDIIVLSDEVYSSYAFKPFRSILSFRDCRYILTSSFSKSHAMTGFRLGYLVSDKETIERLAKIQRITMTSVSEFVQWAGVRALECKEEVRKNAETIRSRADFVAKKVKGLPLRLYRPDGGLYIFPKVELSGFDAEDFCLRILKEGSVALLPGSLFGDYPQHFRMSLCQPSEVLNGAIEEIGRRLL